ncbi:MAG: hypothetical protein QOE41_1841 [Mycobacterium sp.]|nr:hypothetical protein [Mycobacterium sp.]MDT5132530.1 hypothetical protein [Mycobacterium sp.]
MSHRLRFWSWAVASVPAVVVILAGIVTIATPGRSAAETCRDTSSAAPLRDNTPCTDVLAREARWLTAITDGDKAAVDSILDANFEHITSQGILLNRAEELDSTVKQPFTMNPTEQTVDFTADAAVVHGVNTLTQAGTVVARERFTDVFVNEGGNWSALSAQETGT